MSAYQRSKRPRRNDARHGADHTIAAKRSDPEPVPNAPPRDCDKRGTAAPSDNLLPATVAWVATLAFDVRPKAICQYFPRIANELAALWTRRPDEFGSYLNELLVACRRGRKRLPIRLARELHALRSHHITLHPDAAAVRAKPRQPR
jgi:hypothetical protein